MKTANIDEHIDYAPTEKQAMFHRSDADELLFGGAAGGGKTAALAMEAAQRCMEQNGMQIYLFRRSYRELMDTLVLQAKKFIPKSIARFNANSMSMDFINGSSMKFRHCFNDSDRFQYAGVEIHALFIDELTHFSKTVYDFLKTRLRAEKRLGIRPIIRCASNPGGPGHAWVKRHFIDAGEPFEKNEQRVYSELLGAERVRTIQYIPARVTDNPHIGKEYVFELESKPSALRNALLLGKWDAFEGQVFDEWRDEPAAYDSMRLTHVINPFEIPQGWKRYRAFDFGYAKPFAVLWFALDADNTAYLYREWYGANGPDEGVRMTAKDIARGIADAELQSGERNVVAYADPSIWDASRGESIAEQMEKEGIFFQPGDNARIAGKMQLHKRLRFDKEGKPGLYVFKTCRDFIRTVPALSYDKIRPEDVDTRGEDHIYDATRYFLMARPVGEKEIVFKRREFNPLED